MHDFNFKMLEVMWSNSQSYDSIEFKIRCFSGGPHFLFTHACQEPGEYVASWASLGAHELDMDQGNVWAGQHSAGREGNQSVKGSPPPPRPQERHRSTRIRTGQPAAASSRSRLASASSRSRLASARLYILSLFTSFHSLNQSSRNSVPSDSTASSAPSPGAMPSLTFVRDINT